MAVEQDKEIAQEFITEIKTEMSSHQGVLASLTMAINAATSDIQSLNTEEKDSRVYSASTRLTAHDRVHLVNITRKIRVMSDVIKVTRNRNQYFMNPTRYTRIYGMLARRQPNLTVCMEQIHKPRNTSAIIRIADAAGIHEAHAVQSGSRMRTMVSAAAGSNSWIWVRTYRTIGDIVAHLRGRGVQIPATHLSNNAADPREIDYTCPTCTLMRQERAGITQEVLVLMNQNIIIPMIGVVQSLNVSVASILILYEAQRQRQNAGMYPRKNSMLPKAEQQCPLFESGYLVLVKIAKHRGLPYPHVSQ